MNGNMVANLEVRGYGWRAATMAMALIALSGCANDTVPSHTAAVPGLEPMENTLPNPVLPLPLPGQTITTALTNPNNPATNIAGPELPAAAPTPEHEFQPGEVLATMQFPSLCGENITVLSIGQNEIDEEQVGTANDSGGGSFIDDLIPEVIPQPDCTEAQAHAEASRQINPKYATRAERTNEDYYIDANGNRQRDLNEPRYNGPANTFKPLIGHWPGTPNIGQKGNAVFFGHRTTRSAPFALLDMLQPGDEIITTTETPARTYRYRVTLLETVMATEVDYILNPPDSKDKSMVTLQACTPQRGDAQRLLARLQLVPD